MNFNLRLSNHRKDVYKADVSPTSRYFDVKDHIFNRVLHFIIIEKIQITLHKSFPLKYTKAELKISPYLQIHIKIIPWKFCILNQKNSRIIHPENLYFSYKVG